MTAEALDRIQKRTSKQSRKPRFLPKLRLSQLKTEKKHPEEYALPAWMLEQIWPQLAFRASCVCVFL